MEKKNYAEPLSDKETQAPLLCRFCRFAARFYLLPLLTGAVIWLVTSKLFFAFGGAVLLASFCSFCFYWADKVLARRQCVRIPERHLLAWDLFWGWPGGLLGQKLSRHKTVKISYRVFFWLLVTVNVLLTAFIFYRAGVFTL